MFFGLFDSAKAAACGCPGFLFGHPFSDVVFYGKFEMMTELFIQLILQRSLSE
jgi:hypothetical protein